jgi:DUF971 family protein
MTAPPPTTAATPDEVRIAGDRTRLVVQWPDVSAVLAADDLRAACRCAFCVRDRAIGLFPSGSPGVRIATVTPVAAYAINIAFSDGHDRGIFPWGYLRQLSQGSTASAG